MYTEIQRCRLTGSTDLVPVLSLGKQHLTGVFPASPETPVFAGPVDLVFCPDGGLLQLKQTYDLGEMYGENYGYRSGLNQSMVRHLQAKLRRLLERVKLTANDLVIDIGSNDGTLLGAYPDIGLTRLGIDPSAEKFRQYYQPGISLVVDFFSAAAVQAAAPGRKAKVITSIAMFYDLPDPMQFVHDVSVSLAPDGVWHFEQSYMPLMLQRNAYDTACHEHLEYYALHQVKWMTDRADLKILDVEFNDINGGSFAVTVARNGAPYEANTALVERILAEERAMGLHTIAPYDAFRERVVQHREDLLALLRRLWAEDKTVAALGASTKGNVLLQYCGLTGADIPFCSEVNADKFGKYTPGSLIPIVPEAEARARKPDYLLVLPWHFRDGLIAREREYLAAGGRLLFPLPNIEIVGAEGALV